MLPHLFGFFLGEEWHGTFRWNPDDGQVKITHVVIRLYGALILGQSFLTWAAKQTDDGRVRLAAVRAYAVVFGLTTLALLRAQLTDSTWHVLNWLNLLLFACLAAFYGWFSLVQPPAVFEGLGKVTS
ncbi:ML4 [Symbiodinium necroappetens]|uniref:ML4 protein n=1 Tax=Symbiodinium necroappetens TaxID=1628268 RepID=A0A813CJV7_9DINO|nr:ML4 [Symbiodinium necroappetens]